MPEESGNTDVLVTFLGRVPQTEGGYRKTRYTFAEGAQHAATGFLGWILQQRSSAGRMLILGTAGSMWDSLLEELDECAGPPEEWADRLMAEVEQKRATQESLDAVSPWLARAHGCPVRLRLIPYGRSEMEQMELLRILATEIGEKEAINIDVTHGFRHLPMLALVATQYLQHVRGARLGHLWYGSYDPESGDAPVYDLSGMVRLLDWLRTLSAFEHSGDYGVFDPILESGGVAADCRNRLAEAAYFENILNVGEATGRLRQVLNCLPSRTPKAPATDLLLPLIRQRLDWVASGKQFEKQIRLARRRLGQGDYLRAALYTYEAAITRLCQLAGCRVEDFEEREGCRRRYEEALKTGPGDDGERQHWRLLKDLRNQIAHGSRPRRGEVQRVLLQEDSLREALNDLVRRVEAGGLPSRATAERARPRGDGACK